MSNIRFHDPEKSMSDAKQNITFANMLAVELLAHAVHAGKGNAMKMLMAIPSIAHKFATASDKGQEIRPTSMAVSAEEPIVLYGLSGGKMGYSACWLPQWTAQAQKLMSDVSAPIETRMYIAKAFMANPEFDYSDKVEFRGNFTPEQLKELGFKTAMPQTVAPTTATNPAEALSSLADTLGIDLDTLNVALALAKEAQTVAPQTVEVLPSTPKAKQQNRKR